jgi:hypothetical protein
VKTTSRLEIIDLHQVGEPIIGGSEPNPNPDQMTYPSYKNFDFPPVELIDPDIHPNNQRNNYLNFHLTPRAIYRRRSFYRLNPERSTEEWPLTVWPLDGNGIPNGPKPIVLEGEEYAELYEMVNSQTGDKIWLVKDLTL